MHKLDDMRWLICAALLFAVLSAQAATPAPSAPTVADTASPDRHETFASPFVMLDSSNKYVGRMWTTNIAQLSVDGHRYAIGVQPALQQDGLISPVLLDYTTIIPNLYYAQTGCGGAAYTHSGGADLQTALVQQYGDSSLHLLPLGNRNQQIEARSFFDAQDGCIEFDPPEPMIVVRVGEPIDISRLFRRPFHVR